MRTSSNVLVWSCLINFPDRMTLFPVRCGILHAAPKEGEDPQLTSREQSGPRGHLRLFIYLTDPSCVLSTTHQFQNHTNVNIKIIQYGIPKEVQE